jgi:glucose-6-phosphate isomerase
MDQLSRSASSAENPAALLAASWFVAGNGQGEKSLVVLPYKDRLLLTGRYLQQLVMESLGKKLNRSGKDVFQGISVFGNKGSTDQHAYIQQLRDGKNDFVANFIQVLQDKKDVSSPSLEITPGITSGDYLQGFLLGTSQALSDSKRQSYLITLDKLNEKSLGALLALYERAVGIYAELVDVNAYNQPGVEAGKKAANKVLEVQEAIQKQLLTKDTAEFTAEELAIEIGIKPQSETVYWILEHLAQNGRGLKKIAQAKPSKTQYKVQR